MSKQLKSWGVVFSDDMYHGIDHECRCGANLPFNLEARIPLLVGFTTSCPPGRNRAGVGIFKCHECHEHFWFHFSEITYEYFKKKSQQWRKN